jgi:hypothetical protein
MMLSVEPKSPINPDDSRRPFVTVHSHSWYDASPIDATVEQVR